MRELLPPPGRHIDGPEVQAATLPLIGDIDETSLAVPHGPGVHPTPAHKLPGLSCLQVEEPNVALHPALVALPLFDGGVAEVAVCDPAPTGTHRSVDAVVHR